MLHLILCAEKSRCFPGRRARLLGSLLIYNLVDFCTTCGSVYTPYLLAQEQVLFQGLLQEAEIHSRCQRILSAMRRHQKLCAFLSRLLKAVLDVEIVPPGDEMWMTASGLRDCGNHSFCGECHSSLCLWWWVADQELWPQVHRCIRGTHVLTESHWQHLRPRVEIPFLCCNQLLTSHQCIWNTPWCIPFFVLWL